MPQRKGVILRFDDSQHFDLLSDAQLGFLVRNLLEYSQTGEPPTLDDPMVRMAFSFLASRADKDSQRYDEICAERRENGKKGGRPKKANGFSENQMVSEKSKKSQYKPELKPELKSKLEPELEAERESTVTAVPTPPKPERHKHGSYGWIQLTDEQYNRLSNDLGQAELERCIAYVDESAQTTGNKNKWRDWNLVLRKCHKGGWGLGQPQRGDQHGTPQSSAQRNTPASGYTSNDPSPKYGTVL